MLFRNLGWLVLLLFFSSGATALVYEVVWSKFLSQMIGSTVYAQTVVLAVFMGGLAIGNRVFGKFADRLKQPVQAYGVLEAAIGIYAIAFPFLYRAADAIFISIGSGISEKAALLLVLKGVLSAALLLGPTILMGGTLPLMAAWLQRMSGDAGRRSAVFYSVNSLGAVAGSGLAGFYLVHRFGMKSTLMITAAANILIGIAAILLSRRTGTSSVAAETNEELVQPVAQRGTLRLAGLIVALTGGVSMGLEVLASRSLAMIFGSSLQSFAIVLMAFILGIGLGSAWIASPRRRIRSAEGTIVILLSLAGGWVALLVFNIEGWVEFYRLARTGLGRTDVGYTYNLLLNSLIALVILGFPAAFIGGVLPLMIRVLSQGGAALGKQVGWLLTWNTIGAVFGVLITGFILMPLVGLRNAFAVLALTLGGIGFATAVCYRLRLSAFVAIASSSLAFSLFIFGGESWQQVITSGAFRAAENSYDPKQMQQRKLQTEILFYEDAPDASVGVEQSADGDRILTINGKPDAGTAVQDLPTQFLIAHLPLLTKPDSKDIFLLGWGSGVTAGALLGHPIEQVIVAENCAPVIRAAIFFESWNRKALKDARLRLWEEDGRTVLKLHPQLYDVIITEPSNPWSVGVGSVFSKDFYELCASRLKPGGLMVQWFQLYEMQDEVVLLLLRSFQAVFPHVEIWDPTGGDVIVIGSLQPWPTGPEQFRKGFNIERVRTDMRMLDLHSPELLLARQLASQRTAFAIPGDGPIQSDWAPVLEYVAPKALFLQEFSKVFDRYDERTYQQLLAPAEKHVLLRQLPYRDIRQVFGSFATVNAELFHAVFGDPRGANTPCVFQTPRPGPQPASSGSVYDAASQMFASGKVQDARELMRQVLNSNPDDQQASYLFRVFDNALRR